MQESLKRRCTRMHADSYRLNDLSGRRVIGCAFTVLIRLSNFGRAHLEIDRVVNGV
jgi:hypothetical protein